MEYINLDEGIKVSRLQFGCSRLGKAVKEDTTNISSEILNQAYQSGINFFDTASNYTYGHSEELLGEFINDKRDQVVISTKGGTLISKKASAVRFLNPMYGLIRPIIKFNKSLKKHKKRFNFDPQYLTSILDRSLHRLQTEFVDLYYLHNPTLDVLQSTKHNALLGEYKEKGKAKLTGLSLGSIAEIKDLASFENIDILQLPINYTNYNFETHEYLKKIKGKGIKIIARSPFDRGLLTSYNQKMTGGKFGDRNQISEMQKSSLTEHLGVSEVELALWFMKDLDIAESILFSSFKQKHLQMNTEVFNSSVPDHFTWEKVVELKSQPS
ncbi:aldo/keto reductase [Portibacter marinus]|uniref:aldo/keto reductase n=1 Tax=Portibacter marinus TaxID=2898660 RepID=UPI001F253994|nr:aldo/keto reductase [Portibacter marinus]